MLRLPALLVALLLLAASPFAQDLPAGWSFQSLPEDGGSATGTEDATSLDVFIAVRPGNDGLFKTAGVFRASEAGVVQGTLGTAVQDGTINQSGITGVGMAVFAARTESGSADSDTTRYFAALYVRPDGRIVMTVNNGIGRPGGFVEPLADGTGRWRLRVAGSFAYGEQEVGGRWVIRQAVRTDTGLDAFRPIAAGAIAITSRGTVQVEVPTAASAETLPAGWNVTAKRVNEGPLEPLSYASATDDDGTGWVVRGTGDLWGRADRFYSVWKRAPLAGQGVRVQGRIVNVEADYSWAKGGLAVYAFEGNVYALVIRRPTGAYYVQTRSVGGGATASVALDIAPTAMPLLDLEYRPEGRVTLRADGAEVWSAPLQLDARPRGLLTSTSTDFENRNDAASTTFSDVSITFADGSTQVCPSVPDAVGTDSPVGYNEGDTAGEGCWDAAAEILTIRGGGDVWGDFDRFRYVHRGASSAFRVAASLRYDTNPPSSWAKSGVMLRGSLAPDAPFVFALGRPDGAGTYVQIRSQAGGAVESFRISPDSADRITLSADGGQVRVSVELPAGTTEPFATSFALTDASVVGLAVTSTDGDGSGTLAETEFFDISFDGAPDPVDEWRDTYVLAAPDPLETGSATRVDGGNVFDVTAAGDIWGNDDQFEYIYQPLSGDGRLVVDLSEFVGVGPWAEPWAKAGPMIRQRFGDEVTADAAHLSIFETLSKGTYTFGRSDTGRHTSLRAALPSSQIPLGLYSIERTGDEVAVSVLVQPPSGFESFRRLGPTQRIAGDAWIGFALTSTQSDFRAPGQVAARVRLSLTTGGGTTAQPWTETFDGMVRATSDGGATAWWGGEHAALSGNGALAIGEAGVWRSEPLAASAGLDARLAIDTDGAASGDLLRVLALVGDAEVEIGTVNGQSGTQTIAADGLRGSSVELRLVAAAPGGAFRVTEAALSPTLPPVADEAGAEAPVSTLALSAPAPNPTRGDAWIDLAARDAGTHRLDVIDLLGRRVATLQTDARAGERVRVALPLGDLGAGVYVVRATAPDGTHAAQRLTVVR